MAYYSVVFQPSGRRGEVEDGTPILQAARQLGVDLEGLCGGQQTCGKCKVQIEKGELHQYGFSSCMSHLSPLSATELSMLSAEERASGLRLACEATIHGPLLVYVPAQSQRSQQTVRKSVSESATPICPAVRKVSLRLPPATMADREGDADRLFQCLLEAHGLRNLHIDFCALRELSDVLRQSNWQVTATTWMDREIIAVEPGVAPLLLGAAVDIGTTTVACYLADLATGKIIATESAMNPQVAYGEDVLSRITFAMQEPAGLTTLQAAIIGELNRLLARAAAQVGSKPEEIMDLVVVGNTTMHHLFLGLTPRYIGRSPFTPAIQRATNVKARELGVAVNRGAYVHLLPNEAGFVGADNVGVMIAEKPYLRDEVSLIIDIGTNGEIVLGNKNRLLSTSCATGPALEGAHIAFGMRAAPGAIERVRIDAATLEVLFKVIGKNEWQTEYPPEEIGARGICGAGIIDAIAEMFRCGIILKNGRMNTGLGAPRIIVRRDGRPEFVLAWARETAIGANITISTADIRAVQLAKGALYCGAKVLLKKFGVTVPDRVVLAGAFGSYIDKESALAIGLFPSCPVERVHSVGNAAGNGALLALLNLHERAEAERVVATLEYVELAVEADFEREFYQAMHFPHMVDTVAPRTSGQAQETQQIT